MRAATCGQLSVRMLKAMRSSWRLRCDSLEYGTAHSTADGTVLILGGIGADGQIVQQAENFNPETQQPN